MTMRAGPTLADQVDGFLHQDAPIDVSTVSVGSFAGAAAQRLYLGRIA